MPGTLVPFTSKTARIYHARAMASRRRNTALRHIARAKSTDLNRPKRFVTAAQAFTVIADLVERVAKLENQLRALQAELDERRRLPAPGSRRDIERRTAAHLGAALYPAPGRRRPGAKPSPGYAALKSQTAGERLEQVDRAFPPGRVEPLRRATPAAAPAPPGPPA